MSNFFSTGLETRTIEVMIRRYCRDHHHQDTLCDQCGELLAYAKNRLHHCTFRQPGAVHTSCGNCPVHCYSPAKRGRIREVMRYAGPKMLFSHPLLALHHLFLSLRRPRRGSL